jgi:hypothetical protein
VLLERLEDPEAAAELARQAGSTDSRLAVARFCERSGQLELAMQQYCLAGNCPAAFLVAQRNACMAAFANLARQQRSVEAAELASTHYELDRQLAVAGELAVLAGKHVHAARLFLQARLLLWLLPVQGSCCCGCCKAPLRCVAHAWLLTLLLAASLLTRYCILCCCSFIA